MSPELVLYVGEKNISSWSMRAYVAVLEKGVPFEERTISLREDKDRSRRREIGPTGKVPVLHHRDGSGPPLVVPDSLAIIEYLEEAFPPPQHPALWPRDVRRRAHARWLAAAMHSGFPRLREGMSFNLCFLTRPPSAPPEAVDEAKEILTLWESALKQKAEPGPFLFGAFGAADVMFAPVVVRLSAFRVPTGAAPLTAAYMDSVLSRPSVDRWMLEARRLPPLESY